MVACSCVCFSWLEDLHGDGCIYRHSTSTSALKSTLKNRRIGRREETGKREEEAKMKCMMVVVNANFFACGDQILACFSGHSLCTGCCFRYSDWEPEWSIFQNRLNACHLLLHVLHGRAGQSTYIQSANSMGWFTFPHNSRVN